MRALHRLQADERMFLARVQDVIFCSPFSDNLPALLAAVGPQVRVDARAPQLASVVPAVDAWIEGLARRGIAGVDAVEPDDRGLLVYAYVFQVYQRTMDRFDAMIQDQIAHGVAPVRVPFAEDVLGQLAARGLTDEEALMYFAFFYQLRRGFFFIYYGLIGSSRSMRALRQNLWNNVFTFNTQNYERWYWSHMEDFSTLLLGETGTGKGSAAAAIGRSGFIPFDPRTRRFAHSFSEAFVAINLSQYPETLIESELFGHRKGSFTGAVDNHKGLLESCRPNGTLFLDEIGDVGIPTQIKLLNVLQERTFAPLGGHDTLRFHGRVVAATNHSIDDLRSRGSFREDFYYRLCSDVITLPTLRERVAEAPAELEQLVTPLVARLTGGARPELTATVLAALARDLPPGYAWPGNVRELEQAVRRVLVKGHYNGHLTMQSQGAQARLRQGIDEGRLNAADLVEGYCALLYERYHSYQEVARRTGLDRRTAKKHVLAAGAAALRRL